jgi:hypothetical protein
MLADLPWVSCAMLLMACAQTIEPAPGLDAGPGAQPAHVDRAMEGSKPTLDSGSPAKPTLDSGGPATPHTPRSGMLPPCEDGLGSCPSTSFAIWRRLLDAAAFGPQATFIAAGARTLLVALGDGSFRVVLLPHPGEPGDDYASWPLPAAELVPIAVNDARSSNEAHRLLILSCDETRSRCSLLEGEVRKGMLGSLHETPVPSGFSPRGLAMEAGDPITPSRPCLFGNGLLCLEAGRFREAIATAPELSLNAVALGTPWSLAVGDHGRWFMRELRENEPPVWREQEPLADVSLTHVSVNNAGGVITGAGRVQTVVGTELTRAVTCSPEAGLTAFHLAGPGGSFANALMESGEVRWHRAYPVAKEAYCAHDRIPPAKVVATTFESCGGSANFRALQADALWGTNSCVLVP